jgi:type VI secretion system protein
MREERLLERIKAWEKKPERRSKEDPRRTKYSIKEHLERILNTKTGNVPIADDYGVPDFTDLLRTYPDSVRDFERSIKHTIQKYEPRLKVVRLNLLPPDENLLSLRFKIVAKLVSTQENLSIETVLDSDGKMKNIRVV